MQGLPLIDPRWGLPWSPDTPIGPLEFVGLIRGARTVITDSFHAACFAVILEKPLYVHPRTASDSRILSLLALCGIPLTEWEDSRTAGRPLRIDWLAASSNVKSLRQNGLEFLRAALSG